MLKLPAERLWLLLRPAYFIDIPLELLLRHPVPAKSSTGRGHGEAGFGRVQGDDL